jgi:hypothetical protein
MTGTWFSASALQPPWLRRLEFPGRLVAAGRLAQTAGWPGEATGVGD